MKRVIKSTFADSLDYSDLKSKADQMFTELTEIEDKEDDLDYLDTLRDMQREFYQKYRPFADKCEEILNTISPSGYGGDDFRLISIRELARKVDNNFPYGWR